jgi:hypothetical protein
LLNIINRYVAEDQLDHRAGRVLQSI